MLTFGSLFAGIGGLDLGLERAGMKCLWQVEINELCQKVLTKHWPNVPKYRDIRECGENLERVDLICGGFPCQDVSVAGKRAGITGARSGLWSEYARIIRILRPRYVLVENVPGLLSSGFGRVLGDLAESGYDAEWGSFWAGQFQAPHLRERLFLVAHPKRFFGLQAGYDLQGYLSKLCRKRPPNATGKPFSVNGRKYIPIPENLRMDDGIPFDMDRCKALGNAVVPQVAEFIGRRIVEAEVLSKRHFTKQ